MGRYLDLAAQAISPAMVSDASMPLNLERSGDHDGGDPLVSVTAPVSSETVRVPFQRISFDWDLGDGTYTPEQLRKAKLRVKPWGPVQQYTLTVTPWALRQVTAQAPRKVETV
jgi:hypothetical protein